MLRKFAQRLFMSSAVDANLEQKSNQPASGESRKLSNQVFVDI